MTKDYYKRFPSVLRNALTEGKVSFPEETRWEYEPFTAFRAITRKPGESMELKPEDFLSQAEKRTREANFDDIGSYSCSVFIDEKQLKIALKLPRGNKHIAEGKVKAANGPINQSNRSTHVHWWLYEGASACDDFRILK